MAASLHHARALARRLALSGGVVGVGLVMLARPAAAGTPAPAPAPAPTFACAAANGDGTFTYFFGYTLAGSVPVHVEIGPNNQFVGGGNEQGDNQGNKNLGQPTTFGPGSHPNSFSVTTPTTNLQWHLSGTHLKAESSQLCTNVPVVSEAPAALVLPLAAAGPFGVWFAAVRRRAKRAGRAGARPATT